MALRSISMFHKIKFIPCSTSHIAHFAFGFLVLGLGFGIFDHAAFARELPTPSDKYPRIANYYLSSLDRKDYDKLARYDVVILIPELQYYNSDFFAYARRVNPNIIILPYVYASAMNTNTPDDGPAFKREIMNQVESNHWQLRTPDGSPITIGPDITAVNPSSDWSQWYPQYVKDRYLSTGYWDGVFYDIVDGEINHYGGGNIDINSDGVRDDPSTVNSVWQQGMRSLFDRSREVFGPDALIIGNGSSVPLYQKRLNGRMFEEFPTPWEGRGRWIDTMRSYSQLQQLNDTPPLYIINMTAHPDGSESAYAKMRFGLTSTLMGPGFFGYDEDLMHHAQLWWYDEYEASLGRPQAQPVNLTSALTNTLNDGVWQRDFERGIVFVNALPVAKTIHLEQEVEKMHGMQDPTVNDGRITDELTLAPTSGLIVYRPTEELRDTVTIAGSFARILNDRGETKRNGLFIEDGEARGGAQRFDGIIDGIATHLYTDGNAVVIERAGHQQSVMPYGPGFKGSITIALGDVLGNGSTQCVVVPGRGEKPRIHIMDLDGHPVTKEFLAYPESLRSGVSVAVGDVNGDGRAEIITMPLAGGGPQVRLFSSDGRLIGSFFAFDKTLRTGGSIAAGDIDGDHRSEIIVGAGAGKPSEARIFDGHGKLISTFLALQKDYQVGITVGTADIDHDGKAEILVFTKAVTVF